MGSKTYRLDALVLAERWAAGASAVGRHQGMVVFLPGAIPGETWRVLELEQRGHWSTALQADRVDTAPERAMPFCPHYGTCGGCDLQHVTPHGQREAKRMVIEDQFHRIGQLRLPPWEMISGPDQGYRRRVRFNAGNHRWGFFAAKSHQVVEPSHCPLLSTGLNRFLTGDGPRPGPEASLSAYETADGIVTCDPPGDLVVQETISGKCFHLDAQVFFQSNPDLLPDLVAWVMEQAGEGNEAADLFSGVGLFAAFLSERFRKVFAVERNPRCLKHAQSNLPDNVVAVAEAAEEWWKHNGRSMDAVVVDPPRTGLPKPLLQAFCQVRSRTLIYVSCDPATQARDVKDLVASGWRLDAARGFDFYPHTHHMEFAVRLSG